MPAYLIANITVKDADIEAYAAAAGPTLDAYGAEFIMEGDRRQPLRPLARQWRALVRFQR